MAVREKEILIAEPKNFLAYANLGQTEASRAIAQKLILIL